MMNNRGFTWFQEARSGTDDFRRDLFKSLIAKDGASLMLDTQTSGWSAHVRCESCIRHSHLCQEIDANVSAMKS
jgi:hypothetical protein